jgi:hypothetical protein
MLFDFLGGLLIAKTGKEITIEMSYSDALSMVIFSGV